MSESSESKSLSQSGDGHIVIPVGSEPVRVFSKSSTGGGSKEEKNNGPGGETSPVQYLTLTLRKISLAEKNILVPGTVYLVPWYTVLYVASK